MTTTENTHAERVDTPAMGFDQPANWVIGPAFGSIGAGLLVGWMTFIPTWVIYTIVGLVALWLVLKLADAGFRRRSREDQQEDGVPG